MLARDTSTAVAINIDLLHHFSGALFRRILATNTRAGIYVFRQSSTHVDRPHSADCYQSVFWVVLSATERLLDGQLYCSRYQTIITTTDRYCLPDIYTYMYTP